MRFWKFTSCWLVLLMAPAVTSAQELNITIDSRNSNVIDIAVIPFNWNAEFPPPVATPTSIISEDLYRSGLFNALDEDDLVDRPTDAGAIRWNTYKALNASYVVIGNVSDTGNGQLRFDYGLFDVFTQQNLFGTMRSRFTVPGNHRLVSHQIADDIYEAIIEVPGAFATRIAYVTATGTGDNIEYNMMVADSDGFNAQSIITNNQPLLSPAWSPDGDSLAYVSFESGNSSIWIQNIRTGSRRAVAQFSGINGAPEFSPDGQKLALSLSRSGNPEIVILDLASGRFDQITHHYSIDTEPAWSPDGQTIFFTSDRSGRPQIYEVPAAGGRAARVTREGNYNATVSVAPDGRHFAVAQGLGNQYRIAVLDRDTNNMWLVSDGQLDESPSFAPNGSMILYASKERGRGVLSAVSRDGNVRIRLVVSEGDVREPAWSPVIR